MLRVLAFRTEEDEVLPPALLVLATDGRLLEMTLRVDGLDAAGFLAMLLLPPDLLPALLLDDRDDRDEPPGRRALKPQRV